MSWGSTYSLNELMFNVYINLSYLKEVILKLNISSVEREMMQKIVTRLIRNSSTH